jgi:hypothetical protein
MSVLKAGSPEFQKLIDLLRKKQQATGLNPNQSHPFMSLQ